MSRSLLLSCPCTWLMQQTAQSVVSHYSTDDFIHNVWLKEHSSKMFRVYLEVDFIDVTIS